MKFAAASLFLFLCSLLPAGAQTIQVDLEEFRRLQGEVADLREAKSTGDRKISDLQKKIESLQRELRESSEKNILKQGDFITREDIKKVLEQIDKVDSQRENDKKVILEEFEKLAQKLSQPASRIGSNGGRTKDVATRKDKEKEKEAETEQVEGTFYPHKVKSGETFGEILQAYNAALKNEGRPAVTYSQVKKANPRINLDRIHVGQEILFPVPDKK
jgi:TolA-binding protein